MDEHGQMPVRTEPVDTPQISNVAANDSVQGVLVQSNKIRDEIFNDDDPDSKRRYANPLDNLICLCTNICAFTSCQLMFSKKYKAGRKTNIMSTLAQWISQPVNHALLSRL